MKVKYEAEIKDCTECDFAMLMEADYLTISIAKPTEKDYKEGILVTE